MNSRNLMLVFAVILALAATNSPSIPVTTYLSDLNSTGTAYYIQSDSEAGPLHGLIGEYDNGLQNATSILNANTYNHQPPGDWQLDLLSSAVRTMRLTLGSVNEIQPGQPGYTVPPNPPFQGTLNVVSKFEEKCTGLSLDMGTMNKVGQTFNCPAVFRFNWSSTVFYRVIMAGSWGGAQPETTQVQIKCNSLASNGFCNDWFIDPIPVTNPDGTTSPGQTIARLIAVSTHGGSETNEGDLYMTFHVHVTRP